MMKIKTISLILIILMIPALVFAGSGDMSSTARIKFVLGDVDRIGYSSNQIESMSDVAVPVGEVSLVDSFSKLVSVDNIYAYWQINLSGSKDAKVILTITQDMVNDVEASLGETERKMTLPMTVEIVNQDSGTTEKVITGKSSSHMLYAGGAGKPESGSRLLKISCPLDRDTNAGEYKGEITLTLEV